MVKIYKSAKFSEGIKYKHVKKYPRILYNRNSYKIKIPIYIKCDRIWRIFGGQKFDCKTKN